MSDLPGREARLRPEFAHLYPAITAGQWESATILADRLVSLMLRNPLSRFIAIDRILPPEHFDFRGDTPRPTSLPEGQSRCGDSPLQDLERQADDAKKGLANAGHRVDQTLERAEHLQEKSRELGEAGEEIRKKAAEPIGFPPPPPKGKGKPG